jgi:hypothetical protein
LLPAVKVESLMMGVSQSSSGDCGALRSRGDCRSHSVQLPVQLQQHGIKYIEHKCGWPYTLA